MIVELLTSRRLIEAIRALFAAGFDTAEIGMLCRMSEQDVVRLRDWSRTDSGFAGEACCIGQQTDVAPFVAELLR